MAISQIGGSGSSGGGQPYEQVFTSSGVWTKPAGVKTVEVTLVGGGGCGNGSGYSAGGGGAFYRGVFDVSALPTVAVTVGAGGGQNQAGGTSSFGNLIAAGGGATVSGANLGGKGGAWYLPNTPGNAYVVTTQSTSNYTTNFFGSSTWTSAAGATGSMVYNGTYSLAVNAAGNTVRKTTDGITFTNAGTFANAAGNAQALLAWGNGLWVAGSRNSAYYYTSPDGVTWTERSTPNGASVSGVSFADGKWFMGTTTNKSLYQSTNAISWTSVGSVTSPSSTMNFGKIVYTGSHYVTMPTDDSHRFGFQWSTDLVSWTGYSSYYVNGANTVAADIYYEGGYLMGHTGSGSQAVLWRTTPATLSSGPTAIYPPNNYSDTITLVGGILTVSSGSQAHVYYSKDYGTTWTLFQNGYYMRPGVANGATFLYAYQTSGPFAYTVTGYAGQFDGFLGIGATSAGFGGGAGGPALSMTNGYYVPGAAIEGYGLGGSTANNVPGANFGQGGCYINGYPAYSGVQGLVRVKWWV